MLLSHVGNVWKEYLVFLFDLSFPTSNYSDSRDIYCTWGDYWRIAWPTGVTHRRSDVPWRCCEASESICAESSARHSDSSSRHPVWFTHWEMSALIVVARFRASSRQQLKRRNASLSCVWFSRSGRIMREAGCNGKETLSALKRAVEGKGEGEKRTRNSVGERAGAGSVWCLWSQEAAGCPVKKG